MEVHAKLQFTFCQGVERKPLVHCHGWTGRGENTRTVALINSLYQHSTLIMIIVAILILMADLIQGLRVSDAWVDDIDGAVGAVVLLGVAGLSGATVVTCG